MENLFLCFNPDYDMELSEELNFSYSEFEGIEQEEREFDINEFTY